MKKIQKLKQILLVVISYYAKNKLKITAKVIA